LEELATEARNSLGLPDRKPAISKIEVAFVDSEGRTEDLRGQIETAHAAIKALREQLEQHRPRASDDDVVRSIPDKDIQAPPKQLQHKPPELPTQDWSRLLIIGGPSVPGIASGSEYQT
jgi:hypothetical protein